MHLPSFKRLAAATAIALGLGGIGTAAYAGLIDADVTVVAPIDADVPVASGNFIANGSLNSILSEFDVSLEDIDVDVLEDIVEESDILNGIVVNDVTAIVTALLEVL